MQVKPLLTIEKIENFGPISRNKDPIELMPITIFIGANNTGKSLIAKLLGTLILYKARYGKDEIVYPWFRLGSLEDLKMNLPFFMGGLASADNLVKYDSKECRVVIKDFESNELTITIKREEPSIESSLEYYAIPISNELIENIRRRNAQVIKCEGNLHEYRTMDVLYIPPGKALLYPLVNTVLTPLRTAIDGLIYASKHDKELEGRIESMYREVPSDKIRSIIKDYVDYLYRYLSIGIVSSLTVETLWCTVGALTARSIHFISEHLTINETIQMRDIKDIARELFSQEVYIFAGYGIPHILAITGEESSPQPFTSSGFNELTPTLVALDYALSVLSKLEKVNTEGKFCIIVDEPEAHLHPEAQVKLAYKFAEIVNKYKPRLHLLLSSHSDLLVEAILRCATNLNILSMCRLYGFEYDENVKGVIVRKLTIYENGTFEPVEGFVKALEELFLK